MKKIIYLLLLINIDVSAQAMMPVDTSTKKITFVKKISLDTSYTADILYNLAREWASNDRNFRRGNTEKNRNVSTLLLGQYRRNTIDVDQYYENDKPIKLEDPTGKKIIARSILKYTGTNFGCPRLMYFEYEVILYVKDQKTKIEITNFSYTHYDQTNLRTVQIYGASDKVICNSKNTIENLMKCPHCEEGLTKCLNFLKDDCFKLMEEYEKFIISKKPKNLNDW